MKAIVVACIGAMLVLTAAESRAQDADGLIKKVKEKLSLVNDYQAEGAVSYTHLTLPTKRIV